MKPRLIKLAKITAVLLILTAILYVLLSVAANRQLAEVRKNMAANGRPMALAEIIPQPVSDGDKASLLYEAATLQLRSAKVGEITLFERLPDLARKIMESTATTEEVVEFETLLAKPVAVEALAVILRATEKPARAYYHDLDFTQFTAPNITDAMDLSLIMCANAVLQANDGKTSAAWDTLLVSLKLADAMRDIPAMVYQLVRMIQFSNSAAAIQQVAIKCSPTPEQFTQLDQSLSLFDDYQPLVRAIDGERLMFGDNWERIKSVSEIMEMGSVISMSTRIEPLLVRNHSAYLTVMSQYADAASQPYSIDDLKLNERLAAEVPKYCVVTRSILYDFQSTKIKHVRMVARARICRMGVAAFMHHHTAGSWPESMEKLATAEQRMDPFSLKDLHYRHTEEGFQIYSVGPNMEDEGDKEPERGYLKCDIVWSTITSP